MIHDFIYSLFVLTEKLVFQQTVVKIYYIIKILIFLNMEDDGQIPFTDS